MQREVDLARRRLLGLLDESPQDHHALFLRGDVERPSDAGLPLEANLPERSADVADVRFFTLGKPTDAINSEIRTNRARMSGGSSSSSASTVSFSVSTAHAMEPSYQIWYRPAEVKRRRVHATRRNPSTFRNHSSSWFQLAKMRLTTLLRFY